LSRPDTVGSFGGRTTLLADEPLRN
jgi:hypothetical protein